MMEPLIDFGMGTPGLIGVFGRRICENLRLMALHYASVSHTASELFDAVKYMIRLISQAAVRDTPYESRVPGLA
jgi:hypothetical protein